MKWLLVALVFLGALASPTLLASPASAAGGYSSSRYNPCPKERPYYKCSYTRRCVCSRYP